MTYLLLPAATAGVALAVLTLAHGLRLATGGDQRYAGHVLLCAVAGLLCAPAVAAWAS